MSWIGHDAVRTERSLADALSSNALPQAHSPKSANARKSQIKERYQQPVLTLSITESETKQSRRVIAAPGMLRLVASTR
jgi:hypothetical protein